ncbi:MAG: hypothetical protein FWD47_09960 [Treponema sp.]|nr:hypothetical protein [Treponema sp.]
MRKIFYCIFILLFIFLTSCQRVIINKTAAAQTVAQTATHHSQWTWTDVELNGMGWITGLVVCPSPPYQIYARSDVAGVFRYDRRTQRWVQLLDSFGLDDRNVYSVDGLAVDHVNGNILYFAGNPTNAAGEIWKSVNAGESWQPTGLSDVAKVYMGGNDDYRSDVGERIAVDPNNGNVIYFGSRRDGLWRKIANNPWEKVSGIPQFARAINTSIPGYTFIAFDKNGGTTNINGVTVTSTFYVGAFLCVQDPSENGVYKTQDGGRTFVQMQLPQPSPSGHFRHPLRGAVNADGIFITTTEHGILRGTRNSNALTNVVNAENLSGLAVNPDGRRFTVLGNAKEHPVYFSDVSGQNWTNIPQRNGIKIPYQNDDWCHPERGGYIIDPADRSGRTAFAGTGFGVIKTVNLAASEREVVWDDHTQGMSILCVSTVKAAPVRDGHDLHAAVLDMGGFSIRDIKRVPTSRLAANNAGTFNVEWNIPLTGITGMDYSYWFPKNMVYVGWHEFGYYTDFALKFGTTTDGGNTWNEISIPHTGKRAVGLGRVESAGVIAMSSKNPNNLVYSPTGGFVRYSMDMGKTWHDASANIAQGVGTKFFMDSNLNAMYERLMPFWTAQNIVSDKINGNVFYLFTVKNGMSAEFWRSDNGGRTWRRTYTRHENAPDGINSVALPFTNVRVNPAKEGDVFIAIRPGHDGEDSQRPFDYKPLWRSTDRNCTNFETVDGVQFAIDVAFGKGDSPDVPYIYIYGKANNEDIFGVYLSKDDARTWTRITSENQQFGRVQGLEADMRYRNRVFLYTGGRGIVCGQTVNFTKEWDDWYDWR